MNFEEEMSRFEAEINRSTAAAAAAVAATALSGGSQSQFPTRVALPPPQVVTIPTNFRPPQLRGTTISAGPTTSASRESEEDLFSKLAAYEQDHKKEKKEAKKAKKAAKAAATTTTVAAAPKPALSNVLAPPVAPLHHITSSAIPMSAKMRDESFIRARKQKKIIRTGGGQVWEDPSLKDWDPSDFRLFCGDLGNDVTDEVLARTFGRYPSFQKAKVIRDKKSSKTKGYGFVSFRDPDDFTKAIRELNGKYVGSRPIKLKKSQWRERNVEVVRQKQKEKQKMGYKW